MVVQFDTSHFGQEYHICQSRCEGDWIIFTCPHCAEYEQRINYRTKERISFPADDPTLMHQGSFLPVGLKDADFRPN